MTDEIDSSIGVGIDFGELDSAKSVLRDGAYKDEKKRPPENPNAEDVEFAREKVRFAMEVGARVLENAETLTKITEDVRAVRVVASLIDSIAHSADRLVRLREQPSTPQVQGSDKAALPPPGEKTFVFVGSPAQLQQHMDSKMKVVEGESK